MMSIFVRRTSGEQSCSVCGDGFHVGNPSAVFSFPGYASMGCNLLERSGSEGMIPTDECKLLSSLISDTCSCQPNNAVDRALQITNSTSGPADSRAPSPKGPTASLSIQPITLAPASFAPFYAPFAPVYAPFAPVVRPTVPCNVCGEGFVMTRPWRGRLNLANISFEGPCNRLKEGTPDECESYVSSKTRREKIFKECGCVASFPVASPALYASPTLLSPPQPPQPLWVPSDYMPPTSDSVNPVIVIPIVAVILLLLSIIIICHMNGLNRLPRNTVGPRNVSPTAVQSRVTASRNASSTAAQSGVTASRNAGDEHMNMNESRERRLLVLNVLFPLEEKVNMSFVTTQTLAC